MKITVRKTYAKAISNRTGEKGNPFANSLSFNFELYELFRTDFGIDKEITTKIIQNTLPCDPKTPSSVSRPPTS